LNKQQEEISRLLITIDELRSRIEMVREMQADGSMSPEAIVAVQGVMKKAGLKEIMEAANVPKLKGVFERLYQDAIQRIQRLGLIRERMLIANKAYSNIVNAIVCKAEENVEQPAVPDLDRLSSTAQATLSGMWYHTDFLFKNTCEYAIAQGVESSLMKSQKMSLSEVMEAQEAAHLEADALFDLAADGDDPSSPNYKLRKRASARPGRRGGERPSGPSNGKRSNDFPGSTATGDSHAFWSMPGGLDSKGAKKSPRSTRKENLADPEPSSFSSYIANLREARGDLGSDEWKRVPLPERIKKPAGPKDMGNDQEFIPKTLKGAVSMTNSRSLPLLPKGRGGIAQASDDDADLNPSRRMLNAAEN